MYISAVNNLKGLIPNEVSVLFTLENFNLFANSITGILPRGLAGLESLISLDFQQNLLIGPAIPTSVTRLSTLVSYRVSNNQLGETIPTEISRLRNLKELWAGENNISGSIPSNIGDLRNLKTVFINIKTLKERFQLSLGLFLWKAW